MLNKIHYVTIGLICLAMALLTRTYLNVLMVVMCTALSLLILMSLFEPNEQKRYDIYLGYCFGILIIQLLLMRFDDVCIYHIWVARMGQIIMAFSIGVFLVCVLNGYIKRREGSVIKGIERKALSQHILLPYNLVLLTQLSSTYVAYDISTASQGVVAYGEIVMVGTGVSLLVALLYLRSFCLRYGFLNGAEKITPKWMGTRTLFYFLLCLMAVLGNTSEFILTTSSFICAGLFAIILNVIRNINLEESYPRKEELEKYNLLKTYWPLFICNFTVALIATVGFVYYLAQYTK